MALIFTNNIDNFMKDLEYDQIYFVHIPRTSGLRLYSPLIEYLGHCFHCDFAERIQAKNRGFANYQSKYFPNCNSRYVEKKTFKFSIIRNPFDMLCSHYFVGPEYDPNNKYHQESGWASVNYTHNFKSFEEYVRAYCDPTFSWHVPLLKNFLYSQLFDENDDCKVDLLIKFENSKFAINTLNKFGFSINEKRYFNQAKRKTRPYQEYYTQEMVKLVNEKCYKELNMFKYNFENTYDVSPFVIPNDIKYNLKTDTLYLLEDQVKGSNI